MSHPKLILRLHPDNYRLLEQMALAESTTVQVVALAAINSILAGWLQEQQIPAIEQTKPILDISQTQSQ